MEQDTDPYEGMTNQDVDPVDVFEEMREAEYRLDAEQEARNLAAEQDQAAEAGDDLDECDAEFIDGTWYGCGVCESCLNVAHAEDQAAEFDEVYA